MDWTADEWQEAAMDIIHARQDALADVLRHEGLPHATCVDVATALLAGEAARLLAMRFEDDGYVDE